MSNSPVVLIDQKEVEKQLGLKKTAIFERLNSFSRYHDPAFPRPVKIGIRGNRFVKAEVDAYAQSLIEKRNLGTLLKSKLADRKTDDIQKLIRGK